MPRSLRSYAPAALVAVVALALFVTAGPLRFPMDDAYIHLVYGRNLAEHGLLTFNLNPPDRGIGTTSVLWTLLLAALHPLLGVQAAARLLGILGGLATVVLSAVIADWITPRRPDAPWAPASVAVLVALSGNLLWFSLSGMETMLWLALGLGVIVAYRARRFALIGLLIGLMCLCRAEGVVLLAALWLTESLAAWRQRRGLDPGLWLATALALLVWTPWLGYVHAHTGHWLPTSFAGKKHAQLRGAVEIMRKFLPAGAMSGGPMRLAATHLPWWRALIYPTGAFFYGLGYVAGAGYLPGPRLVLGGNAGQVTDGGLAWLGLLAFALVFAPCCWRAARRAWQVLAQADRSDPRRLALAALAVWFALHNLAYWLKLPTPGTASRYQCVNHVAVWLLAGAGAWRLVDRRRAVATVLALLLLAISNATYWRAVYGSDCRHMDQVRLAAAAYASAELPAGAVLAAHDIGALGWAGGHRLLDLGGLIDPAYLEYAAAGEVRSWLQRSGARYVVLPDKHSSESAGFYDYAAFLGLDAAHGVRLTPIAHFENSYADWKLGARPTWNALPAVTIYQLDLSAAAPPAAAP
jgi:hypothetical protein